MEPIILVVNPGSSSRKYAFFKGESPILELHFEIVGSDLICHVKQDDLVKSRSYGQQDVTDSLAHIDEFMGPDIKPYCIGIRIVAPSGAFTHNRIVDESFIEELKVVQKRAPLHIGGALREIEMLRQYLPDIPLVAVSDSAFHLSKPDIAWNYGIPLELSDRLDIKRYGYHGISNQSVVDSLSLSGELPEKLIVCHLGSGSSVTAIKNGLSLDNTMGYSPLEGVLMATRSGNIDTSAALALKHELGLDDVTFEDFLNRQSGLLGISGQSSDIRRLLELESAGDYRAGLALRSYVYKIQQAIGQMAAVLGGVDMLVFTGTIGERSFVIRERIVNNLSYLGFYIDERKNNLVTNEQAISRVSGTHSRPLLTVKTNEALTIAQEAIVVLGGHKPEK